VQAVLLNFFGTMQRQFHLRAIPLALQPFSSSSLGEACEKYQFQHMMIHRGENCKDLAYCGSCACVSHRYLQCFGPKNWVQSPSIDVQLSVFFLFFLNGFDIKKYLPLTLRCCLFYGFNACSNWHGSVLSYFFDIAFT
jgi:hypothetical protein